MLWDFILEKNMSPTSFARRGKDRKLSVLKGAKTRAFARPSVVGGTPDLKRGNEHT
jgi:hypothetical protein